MGTMVNTSQLKLNVVWLVVLLILMLLMGASCSLLEDTINAEEGKTPVNVTLASYCSDKADTSNERIFLDRDVQEIKWIVDYFRSHWDLVEQGKAQPLYHIQQIQNSSVREFVDYQAQEAWIRSINAAAKDDFLDGKMQKDFYGDVLMRLYGHAGKGDTNRNCYQIFFTYHYTPYKITSSPQRSFRTRILIRATESANKDIIACAIGENGFAEFQELNLCLDESHSPSVDNDGDDDDDWDDDWD